MKKLSGILIIVFGILLLLAFTVPTRKDFEDFISEKIKEKTEDDVLGVGDFLMQNLAKLVFIKADYTDVKIGSTYTFSLGKDKDYKFVGFGTIIICVEGDLTILDSKNQ